jgi:hypothetical protein
MADPWFNESSNMACGPWRFGSGSVQTRARATVASLKKRQFATAAVTRRVGM